MCAMLDVPLVHVSTDYVFDGAKGSPYVETDPPNPLSVYGATKLDGDRSVERAGLRRSAILRTSWLFSEIGDTFPRKVLRRLQAGDELRVVDDQVGCPTSARGLARAMQAIGLRLMDDDPAARGLFNYCGADAMSWFGFAERIMSAATKRGVSPSPLRRIASEQLNAAARRPVNSVLSCDKIVAQCAVIPESSEAEIERIVPVILAMPAP
jgi:dTDP-4-dehydrorhamnose reductase